jgi:GAF domain-containing protein
LAVELGVHAAVQEFVVEVAGQVDGAIKLAQLYQRAADRGGRAAAGEVAKEFAGLGRAGGQGRGDAQQIIPVTSRKGHFLK